MPLRAMEADVLGEGPAVVLLHGQPGDRHDWDLVAGALGRDVRVLVPDRPGYGRTGGRAGGFAANSERVIELLDRHGIDRALVVGYSWGGGVALDVAQRHADRVTGVVLVSSIGGPGSVNTLDRLLAAPLVGPLMAIAGFAALRASRIRRLLAPAVDALPDGWLASWRSFVAEERAMLRELPRVTSQLGVTDVPVVVVFGDADRVVPPGSQEALAASLPHADVVRVPGCGHLLPREAPDALAGAISAAANSAAR